VRRDALKLVGARRPPTRPGRSYDLAADPDERGGQVVATHELASRIRSPDPDAEGALVGDPAALAALGYAGSAARALARVRAWTRAGRWS
jgi:hypothetical protein